MEIESIIKKQFIEKREIEEKLPIEVFNEFWKSDQGYNLFSSSIIGNNGKLSIFYLHFLQIKDLNAKITSDKNIRNKFAYLDNNQAKISLDKFISNLFSIKKSINLNLENSNMQQSNNLIKVTSDIKNEIEKVSLENTDDREYFLRSGLELLKTHFDNEKDKHIAHNNGNIKDISYSSLINYYKNQHYFNDLLAQKLNSDSYLELIDQGIEVEYFKKQYHKSIDLIAKIIISWIKLINEK